MKKFFYVLMLSIGFTTQAQVWTDLDASINQPGLELNPLKGIASNFDSNNEFPHSISSKNFTFGELIEDELNAQGNPVFNFTKIEAFIDAQAQMGRFAMIQINVDDARLINPLVVTDVDGNPLTDDEGNPTYVGSEHDLPDFLDSVNRLYYQGRPPVISADGVEPVEYAEQITDPNENVFPWDEPVTDGNGNTTGDGGGNPSIVVDYNDQDLVDVMVALITELGTTFDQEEGLFIVHYGMYGIFGEWGLGSGQVYIDNLIDENGVNLGLEAADWEMSDFNQGRIIDAYQTAFTKTNLVARVPELPRAQSVGYSDGLFFGASLSDEPRFNYFFLPTLQRFNADQNWRNHIIGGEMDPELQGKIWGENDFVNDFNYNVIGDSQFTQGDDIEQNVKDVFEQTHPTYVFQNYMFQNNFIGVEGGNHVATDPAGTAEADKDFPYSGLPNQQFWDNALLATKKMGYTFYIDEFRITASEFKPVVEVNIQNIGIAPMYANWDVEFGYIANGEVVPLGIAEDWNLSTIQPDDVTNYRSFQSINTIPDNNDGDITDDVSTLTFVLRIVNPLEAIITNPTNAKPVRFANTTQDANGQTGWLTLGEVTITGGNLGETPVAVTGITPDVYDQVMGFNEQRQLSVTVLPEAPEEATNTSVTWVSNNPNVLAVDQNGMVTSNNLSSYNFLTETLEDIEITAYTQDGAFETVFSIAVSPYWQLPSRIEAEDYFKVFDAPGGDGQLTTEIITEGSEAIGDVVMSGITEDDWFEYAVEVTEDSYFRVTFRASSPTGQFGDAKLDVVNENNDLLTSISFAPETANINTYSDYISNAFTLPVGEHILRLNVTRSNFNLNWIEFKALDYTAIPQRIEAEDYVIISSPDGNVPTSNTADGGVVLENIDDNDLIEFSVSVDQAADFVLDARAVGFSGPGDAQVNLLLNGNLLLEQVSFGEGITNGTYGTSTSSAFSLPIGDHIIGLLVTRSNFNLNWVEFRFDESTLSLENTSISNTIKVYPNPVTDMLYINMPEANDSPTEIEIYDLLGRLLYKEQTIAGNTTIEVKSFNSDTMIIVQITNKERQSLHKIVVR